MTEDERWMEVALEEGRKGVGLTAPNPAVGAVIVRDGEELARGWHRAAGTDHAEKAALGKLGLGEARGATIYVTLEPCSTVGRTGACSDVIRAAGIQRVVYATADPNPAHAGRADEIFQSAGIEVKSGVREEEAKHLIRGFSMVQREGRPWVIAKTGMSLDGKITRPVGEIGWLTNEASRKEVQELRAEVEALITSGETIRRDDPSLTVRGEFRRESKKQLWRVVMTERGMERLGYRVFTDADADRTLVKKREEPEKVLRSLAAEHGVNTVLLEAGGRLLGVFSDLGLIDEWVIYLAPMVTGGPNPGLGGKGVTRLVERGILDHLTIHRVGDDLCARGLVDRVGVKEMAR